MARPAIQVEGLDEVRRAIRKAADDGLKTALKAANKTVADEVINRALPNVPVRTGRLKATVRGSGTLASAIGRAGNASVPYAAAIHWGRKRGGVIKARPFLHDAAKTVERDIVDRYMDELDKVLDTISAR